MWANGLAFVHYGLALIVSIRVLLRPRLEPTVRLSWILVIELVPLVGIIAYILFGEIRMRRTDIQRMSDVRNQLTNAWVESPYTIELTQAEKSPAIAACEAVGGFLPVGGNRFHLLPESDEAMDDLVAAIDAANEHIHILFYIWLDDVSGRKVAEATIRAAERGVTVRAIVDAIGSRAFLRSQTWKRVMASGVQGVEALPVGNPLIDALFKRVDLRNHRKIVVIDDRIGFTGSRNCSDKAFAAKPRFAPWIDIFLCIEGPVVRQMQAIFLQDWMSYTGENLGEMLKTIPAVEEPGGIGQIVATGPDLRQGSLADCMATMLHEAREEVIIITPYYVPNAALNAAIKSAALRGVDVKLILPERNDSLVVAATSEGFYHGLLRAGVKIYLFKGGVLHTKSIIVDNKIAFIGSANLDRRSFEINYEMNMLVIDPQLIHDLEVRKQSYLARSRLLSHEEVLEWSVWRRLRNNTLSLAAPLL